MTESERISDWCRSYKAAVPSYKAESLRSVWLSDRQLFTGVVNALKLDLAGLMAQMSE